MGQWFAHGFAETCRFQGRANVKAAPATVECKLMGVARNPQYVEFVSRLRYARQACGLTQTKLGRLLHKPQAFVSKVERCERRLDIIEAAEWCVALGTDIDHVLPATLRKSLTRETDKRGEAR